jgi:hypothetical protein
VFRAGARNDRMKSTAMGHVMGSPDEAPVWQYMFASRNKCCTDFSPREGSLGAFRRSQTCYPTIYHMCQYRRSVRARVVRNEHLIKICKGGLDLLSFFLCALQVYLAPGREAGPLYPRAASAPAAAASRHHSLASSRGARMHRSLG